MDGPASASHNHLPITRGSQGARVRDLTDKLRHAEIDTPPSEQFDDAVEQAVRSFQSSRGLHTDGIVGRQTWTALVESTWRLGDRLLYHRASPMLRGDDVAELQRRLGALGFDAGRVDAIFGPDTARALEQFQRNAGLPTDAIFGPDTFRALEQLGRRDDKQAVASVRERDRLLHQQRSGVHRVALGDFGGAGAATNTIARRLRGRGLQIDVLSHPDASHHASVANKLGVAVYLLIQPHDDRCTSISYYSTPGFTSAGGERLATLLCETLAAHGSGPQPASAGQRLAILRETRMPAVVMRIGPAERLATEVSYLVRAIGDALMQWFDDPLGDEVASPPQSHRGTSPEQGQAIL